MYHNITQVYLTVHSTINQTDQRHISSAVDAILHTQDTNLLNIMQIVTLHASQFHLEPIVQFLVIFCTAVRTTSVYDRRFYVIFGLPLTASVSQIKLSLCMYRIHLLDGIRKYNSSRTSFAK